MKDPVQFNGYDFDRQSLLKWFEQHNESDYVDQYPHQKKEKFIKYFIIINKLESLEQIRSLQESTQIIKNIIQ